MLRLIRTIGLIVIAILATAFLIQNLATIEVAFLTWSISAPRAVIFLMLFGLGLIAGYLLSALNPRRRDARHRPSDEIAREQITPQATDTRE